MAQNITTVKPEEFAAKIKSDNYYLLDVRTAEEYAGGHITGAANLDVNDGNFAETAKKVLPRDKTIAVYCGTGKRSGIASGILAEEGFKVLNLEGGLNEWTAAGLPLDDK